MLFRSRRTGYPKNCIKRLLKKTNGTKTPQQRGFLLDKAQCDLIIRS